VPTILIVEDEPKMLRLLNLNLSEEGYATHSASEAETALKILRQEKIDLVLTDLKLPGMGGLEFLQAVKRSNANTPVILMTAYGTVETAVEAMKAGASDYVLKPFSLEEIKLLIRKELDVHRLREENRSLREALGQRLDFRNIVGRSAKMQEVLAMVERVAATNSTVLLAGESGVGKDLIAHAIHHHSRRASGPFIKINCTAIPENLLESELFGYEKGAFTNAYQKKVGHFELAHGGTLFLDEIGELNFPTQAKLLRAIETETFTRLGGIEESKVDVRVIAASNRDLEKSAKSGEFRPDLFYRLNVVSLQLPPLRERRDDIPILLDHFLRLKAQEHSVSPKMVSPEVVDFFMSYTWPGNVRELENLVERLTILSPRETIMLQDLPVGIRTQDNVSALKEEVLKGSRPLSEAVDEFEREVIVKALEKTGFNQTKAASLLGTSRRILRYRMEKLKISEDNLASNLTKVSE